MVGYDGGRVAPRGSPTTWSSRAPSTSRAIQEAQASAYHVLRELVGRLGRGRALDAAPPSAACRGARRGRRCRASASGRFVLPAGARARARPASCSTTRAACCVEVEGDAAAVDALPRAAAPPRRRRWPRSSAVRARGGRRRRGERGVRDRASSARGGEPRRPGRARHRDLRRLPGRALRPAPTAASATRSSTAPNCGPRFTIVRGVPYDRPLTTMAGFAMCARAGPSTRTRATAASTPSRTPARSAGRGRWPTCGGRPAAPATRSPRRRPRCAPGAIVAVKGLGGFHLACRADDEARRRARCARASTARTSPFALMAPDLAAARALVELGDEEQRCWRARAADRARAPPAGRARSPPSVAPRSRRPRRDAPLLAAAPPAARRRAACRS